MDTSYENTTGDEECPNCSASTSPACSMVDADAVLHAVELMTQYQDKYLDGNWLPGSEPPEVREFNAIRKHLYGSLPL